VAKFLGDEWLDAVRTHASRQGQPGRDGDLSVRLHVAVGDVQFHAIVVDGALDAIAPGPLRDADVSLTVALDDAVAIQRGELDPSVAFMQGRMKTAGDPGKLLDLLAWSAQPAYSSLREALASSTEF
jgi:putative sterol carrier protein